MIHTSEKKNQATETTLERSRYQIFGKRWSKCAHRPEEEQRNGTWDGRLLHQLEIIDKEKTF